MKGIIDKIEEAKALLKSLGGDAKFEKQEDNTISCTVVLDGPAFDDRHIWAVGAFQNVRKLVIRDTRITASGLRRLNDSALATIDFLMITKSPLPPRSFKRSAD